MAGSIPRYSGTYQVNSDTSANSIVQRTADGSTYSNIAYADQGVQSAGHVYAGLASKTTAHTADDDDFTLKCDATSAGFTVTLPAAAGCTNQILIIQKTDASANIVTVDADGTETIGTGTTWLLYNQWDTVAIQSDGSNWIVLWWKATLAVITQTGASLTVSSQPTPILYLCDTTSNTITCNLPAVSTALRGLVRSFKKIHASNSMTLDGNASETIDGATTLSATDDDDCRTIVCDGDEWHVINGWG